MALCFVLGLSWTIYPEFEPQRIDRRNVTIFSLCSGLGGQRKSCTWWNCSSTTSSSTSRTYVKTGTSSHCKSFQLRSALLSTLSFFVLILTSWWCFCCSNCRYSHSAEVQVRLQFLTCVFSTLGSPDHFSKIQLDLFIYLTWVDL